MSTRTVEQIDSWSTVPFSGGYGGLHDLADGDFSGAVIAGPARLFMLKGNVVGILDGSIDDFEDASGTAREAPHPGLPLLAVMQERSDEVRAKYYTEDTPIADVDETLSSGGFTGYVELSENVLSGDYYQIYHQGRSMSVAWVGNSDQLVTEDEAFDQANGEVGIYEVRPVDIEILDIPEPAEPEEEEGDTTDVAAGGAAAASEQSVDETASQEDEPTPEETAPDGQEPTPADQQNSGSVESATDSGASSSSEPQEPSTDGRPDHETKQAERPAADPDQPTEAERSQPARERDTSSTEVSASTSEGASTRPAEASTGDTTGGDRDDAEPSDGTDRSTRTESGPARSDTPADRPSERDSMDPDGRRSDASVTGQAEPADDARREEPVRADADSGGVGPAPHDPSASAATDLETRSIPSLDPSHSETASKSQSASDPVRTERESRGHQSGESQSSAGTRRQAATREQERGGTQGRDDGQSRQQPEQQRRDHPGAPAQQESAERSADDQQASARQEPDAPELERIEELEAALDETEAEREELESELDSLASERDELQQHLDEARAEIERLETQLAEAQATDTPEAETRLSQREAIDQTNLFVRYRSKGDATLEAVHSGNAKQSAVDDNLRLEYHTQFDAETAAVGGQEFEAFLTESIQYRFVDWLVRNLLYEIRDTGNPDTMAGLFDALPKIDRAELNGQVTVEYTENGEQQRSQEQFDVVVRDRMGNPLIVANINDSRDPATDDMMTDLITRAERVGSSSDSLAGAFLVTESFFEPPALETAEEATSSGLLSRDKRKSFVNLSRKDGYHLCLVEARNQEFHLAVPEL